MWWTMNPRIWRETLYPICTLEHMCMCVYVLNLLSTGSDTLRFHPLHPSFQGRQNGNQEWYQNITVGISVGRCRIFLHWNSTTDIFLWNKVCNLNSQARNCRLCAFTTYSNIRSLYLSSDFSGLPISNLWFHPDKILKPSFFFYSPVQILVKVMTQERWFCLNSFLRKDWNKPFWVSFKLFTDVSNQISVVSLVENYYSLLVFISIMASIFLSQLMQKNIGK